MLSDELIIDEDFNSLSVEGQCLFMRMLTKSDDCGVVPASPYALEKLTNPPERIKRALDKYLSEIVEKGVGITFEYNGKRFFAFKRDSFDRIQSYVINNRTKSEYLNLRVEEALTLISEKFQEVLGNSRGVGGTPIESRKMKVESRKQKETVPENLEAVTAFFYSIGADAGHAQDFWNYFESNGWRVGGRAPMKDWHAAAKGWVKRIPEFKRGTVKQDEEAARVARIRKAVGI